MANAVILGCGFNYQGETLYTQAAFVQDDWYTVFSEERTRIRLLRWNVAIDTANEDMEYRLIINGTTYPCSLAAQVAATHYAVIWFEQAHVGGEPLLLSWTRTEFTSFLCEARSFTMQMRKTTNNGAGALFSKVRWEAWE